MTRALPCLMLLSVLMLVGAPAPARAAKPRAKPTKRVAAKTVTRTLCGARKPCKLVETRGAGVGAVAEDLTVYELQLAKDADDGCERFEYWLVSSRAGKLLSVQPLLEMCNDGYGAAGVGDDEITVKDNFFAHGQSGGSSWRWSTTRAYQLSPLRVLDEADDSEWVLGQTTASSTWSWDDFAGEEQWFAPRCDEVGGSPDEGATTAKPGDPTDGAGYAYEPIPQVSVPAGYAARDWDWPLGACSLRVDGTSGKGYTVFGKPDAGSAELDSSFRAVFLDEDTLVVDVSDDHLASGGRSWIFDDHLEIWLADGGANGFAGDQCLVGDDPHAEQWGIRISDGRIFAAAGKPKEMPTVTRAEYPMESGEVDVRFRIVLPHGRSLVTVVYSDSDDGTKQERLIASSQLRHGKAYTLGRRKAIAAGDAVCEVVGGSLEPRQTRRFDPKQPIDARP
jgi:hypothetical protein